ncbi:MAG: MFS transporter [Aquabacterium sp.]
MVLAAAVGGMAFPILPVYALKFGVSLPVIGMVLAANRIGRIAATPVVGVIVDRIGARQTLVAGQALQALAMLMYMLGIATSHPVACFLIGRLVHGVASASVFVSAQIFAVRASTAQFGGLVRAAMAAGIPLGLVSGGILSDQFGAMAVFAGAAIATLAGLGGALAMPRALPSGLKPVAAHTAVLLSWGNSRLAAIGVMSFAASFAAHGVVMTTLGLLIEAHQISLAKLGTEGTSGVLMGWMVVLIAAGSPLAGRLGDRLQRHDGIATVGMLAAVPALIAIGISSSFAGMGIGMSLLGLSAAALGPSLLALVEQTTPASHQGKAVGFVQLCGDVGGLLGPVIGTLLATSDAGAPYLASAALMLLSLPAALYLMRKHEPDLAIAATRGAR